MRRVEIFNAITDERDRQDQKFPGQWGDFGEGVACDAYSRFPALHEMTTILGEEMGEVCRAVCDRDLDNLREELVQVAAVAVAFLEALP